MNDLVCMPVRDHKTEATILESFLIFVSSSHGERRELGDPVTHEDIKTRADVQHQTPVVRDNWRNGSVFQTGSGKDKSGLMIDNEMNHLIIGKAKDARDILRLPPGPGKTTPQP